MSKKLLATLAVAVLASGCPKKESPAGGGARRCEVDLAATGLIAQSGSGASARVIDSDALLFGGEQATGSRGDVLLQNDRVRVVVEKPGRLVGPLLTGGHIVDADLVRAPGEPGRDAFGRLGLMYAFGRLSSITDVEVLADGSSGGPAVVASTGHDVAHDLLNVKALLSLAAGLDLELAADQSKPLPLRTTTYYVLSPGENRVRVLTAFCNDGDAAVATPLIELMDIGAFELFNAGGCANGLGSSKLSGDCVVQPSRWFASQGAGVAYGLRTMSFADPTRPAEANALLGYGGVVGQLVEGRNFSGLLSWTDLNATSRPGTFIIRPHSQRTYVRDFLVARDIAGISSTLLALDGVATGRVDVVARLPGGAAAPNARVSVLDASGTMVTLIDADASGKGAVDLAPGTYELSASLLGRLVGPPVRVTVAAGATAPVTVTLGEGRTLSVTVKDPFGAPMPAKVTVLCPGGCPFSADTYSQHLLPDWPAGGAAAIEYVPVSGLASVTLPPGLYDVVVTRGPEYSAWPASWPLSGERVDLRIADQSVTAVLGQVVDSSGWVSADLHVHAINSSDSAVRNEVRVANFLAEGVDVLLSTDHDVITDFAPYIRELGADGFIASMIGQEVTSFSHGHFNAFPLFRKNTANGGAYDHAGGEGVPTPRLSQLFSGIKKEHPLAVVQINHPRGGGGALSLLKVDTATLASHGLPEVFNMAPAPDATAADTRLFSDGFDALEIANGPWPTFSVMNDWMTFLSRGTVRTATGVSDTHGSVGATGGYARTYVRLATERPEGFSPAAFADGIRTQRAFVTNGPFLRVTARRMAGGLLPVGPTVGMGETLSIDAAAGDTVEVLVDVQGLDWMTFDRVELYGHAPGREAVDGESNSSWPESRILDKHVRDPANLPLEPVGQAGVTLRRLHLTDRFVTTPTRDGWLVVMVRATQGRSLWPLHEDRPIAWSNAILIDADGSGRYDDFPLKAGQRLRVPPRPAPPSPPRAPTPHELAHAIDKLLTHTHKD